MAEPPGHTVRWHRRPLLGPKPHRAPTGAFSPVPSARNPLTSWDLFIFNEQERREEQGRAREPKPRPGRWSCRGRREGGRWHCGQQGQEGRRRHPEVVTALGRVTETPGKLRRAGGKIPACPGDSIQVLSPWDCAWRRQQEAVPWFALGGILGSSFSAGPGGRDLPQKL